MGHGPALSLVEGSCVLKAPYIITLAGPVLKDHAIAVENGVIQQIIPQREVTGESIDLPGTILLPGLINAHCHLELSDLPEPLPYPGSFTGWIEQLSRLKLQMSPAQVTASIQKGIQQLLAGGTTTVADHASVGTDLKPILDSPLDYVAYIEVLGVQADRAQQFYQQALAKQNKNIIPTPHAPYSLLPEVFAKFTSTHLSIHIAESAEEYLLFKENHGPLFEFLQRKGETPPTKGESPLQYLNRLKLIPPKTIAIHANYLEDEDIAILKEYQMSVVHCPGSHAYFSRDRFFLGMLTEAGINVALGTDSLASNHSLSMFEQMRLALDHYPELTPETVLKMATLNGAKALGRENEIGSLAPGKRANIVGVSIQYPKRSILENILFNEKTEFIMIQGQVLPSLSGML